MITSRNLDDPYASGAFGASPPTATPGGGFDIKDFLSKFGGAIPGLTDAVSSYFENQNTQQGLSDFRGDISQGIGGVEGGVGKSIGYLTPYMQRGNVAGGRELSLLQGGQDPTKLIGDITSSFDQSPEQKALVSAGTSALQNRLEAQGVNLSGAADQAITGYAQDQTAKQLNQYVANVLGGRQQTISGLAGLTGEGLSAAGTGAQTQMRGAEDISSLLASLGQSRMAGAGARNIATSGMAGGVGSALSSLLPYLATL